MLLIIRLFLIIKFLLPVILGVIAAVHWRRHKQSIRKGFGFTFHWQSLGDLGAGLLITFLGMSGIFLLELALGGIQIENIQFDVSAMRSPLSIMIIGAVYEEFVFRSLLLSGLAVALGGRKWLAILISAAAFGLTHLNNPDATYISAFGNALGGLVYGIAFLGGKNIWLPLGLHFGWNFFQGPVFGFPVSGLEFGGIFTLNTTGSNLLTGGAYGPEAGLVGMAFRFIIIAMIIYYLQLRCHNRGDIKTLEFPIKIYKNPPNRTPTQQSFRAE